MTQRRDYVPWLGSWSTPQNFPIVDVTKVYTTPKEFVVKELKLKSNRDQKNENKEIGRQIIVFLDCWLRLLQFDMVYL